MTLWRKTTRYYSDEYELRGLLNAFAVAIDSEQINNVGPGEAFPYYMGAAVLLNLLLNHEEIRDQQAMMSLFDQTLRDEGIEIQTDKFNE